MIKNNDIYFTPSLMPDAIRQYLIYVLLESPRGMDWNFCSKYMEEKLDEFPWQAHNLQKPTLPTFCRWAMAIRKKGLNKKTKKMSKKFPSCDDTIKQIIITKVEAIVPKINDSFLGSPKFHQIQKEIESEYGVPIWMFSGVLIDKRKRTPSIEPGNVYAYYVAPVEIPDAIKLGYTEKEDPCERMNQATKNTAAEKPKMIGWFRGSKKDEKELLKYFRPYRVKECSNKEMFKFGNDLPTALDYIKETIKKFQGVIEA